MPVVAAYLYRDGTRVRSVAIDERCDDAKDKSEFVWIGIAEPSHEEMQALQDCYGLHELAVEDAINANQLPKVEVFGDQLFVVARTARLEGDCMEYGETAIFVGRSHIITVRHGSPRTHTALREQLEKAPTLLMHGTDYLLHSVLDFIHTHTGVAPYQIAQDALVIGCEMLHQHQGHAALTPRHGREEGLEGRDTPG